mgnify:FL=1
MTGVQTCALPILPVGYNRSLEGLKLKNVELTLYIDKDVAQKEMGDLDFTNNGIEGPIGFKISRKAVKAIKSGNRCFVVLDLKPALSEDQLAGRINRDLNVEGGISINQLFKKLLPVQLIPAFQIYTGLNNDSLALTKRSRTVETLVRSLKNWKIEIGSYTSYERAVVTAGGVSLDEIFPKSMQSRIVKNLFFAGEVIDLDGDTGGYNLQIAFSTGYLAGIASANFVKIVSEPDSRI